MVEEETAPSPKLVITDPIGGATVQSDMARIAGTYEYEGVGFSIIVNGKRALIDADKKQFVVEDVYLSPGENNVTAVLNSIEIDDPVETSIKLNRVGGGAGNDIVSISLSPDTGFAPQEATLSFLMGDGHVFYDYCAGMGYQKDDGPMGDPGSLELLDKRRLASNEGSFVFALTETGRYKFTFYLRKKREDKTCTEEILYQGARTIVVGTPGAMINEVYDTYWAMLKQLEEGNNEKALRYFTGDARLKYEKAFSSLKEELPGLAAQMSEVINGAINENVAELTIVIDTANGKKTFPVHLLYGNDGIWRIDGM